MASDNNIVLSIELDAKSLQQSVNTIDQETKNLGKSFSQSINKQITQNIQVFNQQVQESSSSVSSLANVLQSASFIVGAFASSVIGLGTQLSTVFLGLLTSFPSFRSGIFSLVAALQGATLVLDGFGTSLSESNNEFIQSLGFASRFAAFLTGGFAFAVSFAILKVGELAFNLGSSLVGSFQKATNEFIDAQRSVVVFEKTIEAFNKVTNDAIGSTESWTSLVTSLSDELNLSVNSLRRASNEIVAVGTRLGLTQSQLEQLLRVTAEYAKINEKDVFQSSVAFVSALNGQSQSVTSYGVKLTEAANQQFLLKKGIDETFRSLTDSQKVQVRFNNLLDQYGDVSGLAAAATNTLAEQATRFEINQERLNVAIGRGAAVIENNNIVAAALNSVLNNVSDSVAAAAGFVGALGARVLQISGFFLQWSFQIIAVTKAIKLLNIVLGSNAFLQFSNRTLPFINTSLATLLSNLTGITTRVTSVGAALSAVGSLALRSLARIPSLLATVALGFGRILIVIAPFVAKIALLSGLIAAVGRAFAEIESRTKIFSSALKEIRSLLDFSSITSQVVGPLQSFGDVLANVGRRIVGAFTFVISSIIQSISLLVQSVPFASKVFGEGFVQSIQKAGARLSALNDELLRTGFLLPRISEITQASTAPIVENLNLQTEAVKRNNASWNTLSETVIGFATLTIEAFSEFASNLSKSIQFTEQELKRLASGFANVFARGITSAIQNTVNAFAAGQNAFEAFGKSILGLVGDLAIFIGQFTVATGIAKTAIAKLPGGQTIAAGLGLIALGTLLKALGGSSSPFLGGGGGGGAAPGFNPAEPIAPGDGGQVNPIDDQEDRDTTRVAINIQGDVFDSQETGLRLVDILNDSFDANGTRLVTT